MRTLVLLSGFVACMFIGLVSLVSESSLREDAVRGTIDQVVERTGQIGSKDSVITRTPPNFANHGKEAVQWSSEVNSERFVVTVVSGLHNTDLWIATPAFAAHLVNGECSEKGWLARKWDRLLADPYSRMVPCSYLSTTEWKKLAGTLFGSVYLGHGV